MFDGLLPAITDEERGCEVSHDWTKFRRPVPQVTSQAPCEDERADGEKRARGLALMREEDGPGPEAVSYHCASNHPAFHSFLRASDWPLLRLTSSPSVPAPPASCPASVVSPVGFETRFSPATHNQRNVLLGDYGFW